MTRQQFFTTGLFLSAGLASFPAGCNDPSTSRQIGRRQENLSRTANSLEEMEETHPRSLLETLKIVEKKHRHDVQSTGENAERVEGMIQQDFGRWRERQPLYKKEIENQLKGDPENIRRTAPQMAW